MEISVPITDLEKTLKSAGWLSSGSRITHALMGNNVLHFSVYSHKVAQSAFCAAIVGGSKIGAIKALREASPGLGLKEAKDAVDAIGAMFTNNY